MLTVGDGPWPSDAGIAPIVLAARLLLGFVFVAAGAGKLRDRPGFVRTVDRYRVLPDPLVRPFAAVLPWTEIAAGVALAAGVATTLAAGVVTAQLTVFAMAMAINLLRGREIDCGCGGAGGTAISWWLVTRNAALAVPAAGVAVATSDLVQPALAPVPAGDAVAVAVTVVAVLGVARLLAYGARVRAALGDRSATGGPRPAWSLAGRGGTAG